MDRRQHVRDQHQRQYSQRFCRSLIVADDQQIPHRESHGGEVKDTRQIHDQRKRIAHCDDVADDHSQVDRHHPKRNRDNSFASIVLPDQLNQAAAGLQADP